MRNATASSGNMTTQLVLGKISDRVRALQMGRKPVGRRQRSQLYQDKLELDI